MKKIRLDYERNEVEVIGYIGEPPVVGIEPLDGTSIAVFTQEEARQVAAILQRFADTGRLAAKAQEEAEDNDRKWYDLRGGWELSELSGVNAVANENDFVRCGIPANAFRWVADEQARLNRQHALNVGDKVINSQNDLCEVMAIYTDGVDTRYQIGGRLLTSYDLISEGYKRVTLVEGEE